MRLAATTLITACLLIAAPNPSLEKLLADKQYLELAAALNKNPSLFASDRSFYGGVLANRQNRVAESARLLEPLLQDATSKLTSEQVKIGLRSLADDYVKSFRYGDAADTYSRLLQRLGPKLTEYERGDIDGSRQTFELLRRAPAQTISMAEQFTISTKKNSLGSIEAPVEIGGTSGSWILDTGANLSVVSRSAARRLGLVLSTGTAPVDGFGGTSSQGHVAVIPSLRIGKAEVHNVAVMVLEDKDLSIPQIHFQFEAILGYPVLSALGRISFYADGRFGAASTPGPIDKNSGELFLEELTPLVTARIGSDTRIFRFDTGVNNTYLTVRYLEEHRKEFAGQSMTKSEMGGAGGTHAVPAYRAKSITITLGGVPVTLHDIAVLAESHVAAKEYFYGHLGQDILKPFRSYTLDFRSMRFSIEAGPQTATDRR